MCAPMAEDPFEVVDSTGLTDADWAEINKLRKAYAKDGMSGLDKAMLKLAEDPFRYCTVSARCIPR